MKKDYSRLNRVQHSSSSDGFIRGFGVCASVFILLIGGTLLGLMIGLSIKDAHLIRVASKTEAPIHSNDFQNVFTRLESNNITSPLILKKVNGTKLFKKSKRNVTAAVMKNQDKAEETYKFEQARTLSSKLRREIHEYWQVDTFPEFKKTMHIPRTQWETLTKKLQLQFLQPNKTKNFIIAFGGSSVTAGHDNYLAESYPSLVRKQLTPIFALLGIKLVVQNVAIGNNPCYPYDICMDAHTSGNVDLISWEQSMNCGRDAEPVENFIRTSAQGNRRPIILLMTSGTPFWESSECNGVNSLPQPLTDVEKRESRLPLDILSNRSRILWDFPFMTAGDGAVQENFLSYYGGVAPIIGQNLMELNKYKCKGPYGPDFGEKTLGKGKSWHPGVKGHKLRADSFSYFFTSILSNALSEIMMFHRSSRKKHNSWIDDGRKFVERHTWQPMRNPLRRPLLCDPDICRSQMKPTCMTMIQPQNNPALSLTNALTDRGKVPVGWTTQLSWLDVSGVEKATKEKRGYLDKKIILVSDDSTTSPLEFIIQPKSKDSVLWLCQVSRGFAKYPPTMGELNTAAVVSIEPLEKDPKKKISATSKVLTMTKVRGENECFQSKEKFSGKSKLTIRKVKESVQINIAYMLYW